MDGCEFLAALAVYLLASSGGLGAAADGAVIRTGSARRAPIFRFPPSGLTEHLSPEELALLNLVLDFAVRYEWDEIVLFLPMSSAMLRSYAYAICGYFNTYGKFISIHSTANSLLPRSLHHNRHRVGVVVLWEPEMGVFFDQLVELDVFNEYRSWLFIRREEHKGLNITDNLKELNLGIYSNAVICKVERQMMPTRSPKQKTTTTTTTANPDDELRYYETGVKVCVPENRNEPWYREICVTGSGLPARIKRQSAAGDPQLSITLQQIYKVTGPEGDSFQRIFLGVWDPVVGLDNTEELVPVEKRYALGSFKIVIGVRNSSFEGGAVPTNSFSLESDEDQEVHMKEVLDCLLHGLNASREISQFAKLGWRNEEGGWTHMLNAVVEGTIDFALDTISVNMDSLLEMSLTHPIVRTMNNIYFRRPESGGMRDIFLAPFSQDLLISVFCTAVLLGLAMISIAVVNYKIIEEDKAGRKGHTLEPLQKAKVGADERKWEVSEAALWSVSVMCMQGSQWCPGSKSGSLLLICGLLFALVIYNAYAAFITSVLSVKSVSIKTLEDLIHSNFAFGYTLGNTDELFLRTVNDSLLRELYFKGLRENDGVKDPIAGMHRAGEGHYAFFVAARTARRALMREVAHNRRCGIQELILPITRSVAAIPMSRRSAFKKILNFRVLRMMETGILHRFQSLVLPPMPKCVERNTFNSARFTDVYSAFYMIVSGWILSCALLIGEILWNRRMALRSRARGKPHASPAVKHFPMAKAFRARDLPPSKQLQTPTAAADLHR